MLRVQDCRPAEIASKRDVSSRRIAACLDTYELFIHSTPHVDGTARARYRRRVERCAKGPFGCRDSNHSRWSTHRRRSWSGQRHRRRPQITSEGTTLSRSSSQEEHPAQLQTPLHCGRTSRSRFPSNSTCRWALCPDTVPRLFPLT